MNKPGLPYGLNLTKKAAPTKPQPAKRKALFGDDDGSEDEAQPRTSSAAAEEITELEGFGAPDSSGSHGDDGGRPTNDATGRAQPTRKAKKQPIESQFGGLSSDLSSALSSRKHAQAAEELDPSIYDYDGVYDSFRPDKHRAAATAKEDADRRPKYLSGLMAAAAVRKRDQLIAEEKKIARERAAEGEEYAGKEKFVTEAYKQQQEENRRLQEEEQRKEEEDARKNKGSGMTGFYRDLLEKGDQRHADMVKAAAMRKKEGPLSGEDAQPEVEEAQEKTEADIAREIIEKGGKVAVNEDGQIVDKRQLLRGGLNVGAKKKTEKEKEKSQHHGSLSHREQVRSFAGAGGKQAMRERQSRMLEEQLEQAQKRSRDEEEQERRKVEMASKSRKTDSDVSSAKERYLARKRAAEEEKRQGLAS